jgi:hypothetical protein
VGGAYVGIVDGGEEEFVVEGEEVHVVGQVLDFAGGFVVWALEEVSMWERERVGTNPVCAVSEGVVSSSVFHSIICDVGG